MYRLGDSSVEKEITEILLARPMSLMGHAKISQIVDVFNKNNLNQILEIGTFVGGSTYILSKLLPTTKITTIDTNNFQEYFKLHNHLEQWQILQEDLYPDLEMPPDSIKEIQKIYKNNCQNVTFLTGTVNSVDISTIDCIIVDGDHFDESLINDLEYSIKNMKSGIIFVDDYSFKTISETCERVAKKKNLSIICFEQYLHHLDKNVIDLCAILTDKSIKI